MADAVTFAGLRNIDPYPHYEAWREKAPLVWDEEARAWLVTSYDICRHIEINEDQFRHPYAEQNPDDIEIKGGEAVSVSIGDRHVVLHRFALQLFAPREIAAYRELHIQPVVDDLIGRRLAGGKADLAGDFLDMVPSRVILSLLNVPWKDDDTVRRVIQLHDVIFEWASGLNPEVNVPRAKEASKEINDILLPHILERRHNPGNDVISRIWSQWPSAELGEPNEGNVLAVARDFFMGGSDTTVHTLSNAFHILLTNPEIMEAVRADRSVALTNLVEEALRLYGALQYRFRIANQDCELGGVAVRKDQRLIVINSAANRDPAMFECPHMAKLDRPRPKEHLAFNKGPRSCIGASLARAEVIDVVDAVLNRLDNLRLDPDAPPPEFPGHFNRSYRPLNVLFDRK